MDEYNYKASNGVKLLRNLCRILALPAVLASTNAKVNNLLNVNNDSDSRVEKGEIWVHAIRKLPSASLKAVINLSGWAEYADANDNIKTVKYLNDHDITYTDSSKDSLLKLISLMKEQSKTCLQGVPLIAYRALKEKLVEQERKNLNVKEIWEYILTSVRVKLLAYKLGAFSNYGPYHSLAIMSNHQVLTENEVDQLDVAPNADIVYQTINEHFYLFGKASDPDIIPFEYEEEPSQTNSITNVRSTRNLKLNGDDYLMCSHFKFFKENTLFCMSLWKDINSANNDQQFYRSVASIVSCYIFKNSNNKQKNPSAMKNDSNAQECVVHWALCYSSMTNVSELNQGAQFLERFINHIQIDEYTVKFAKKNNIRIDKRMRELSVPFSFGRSCPKLVKFLSNIKMPYLVPPNNLTNSLKEKLGSLCEFGTCSRLENGRGIDIEFDLLFKGALQKGYVECKYIDTNIGKPEVLQYIVRSKDSPLSMLVTFSMQACLKSAEKWKSKIVEQEDDPAEPVRKKAKTGKKQEKIPRLTAKEKQEIINGFSVYSVFYIAKQLKIVPLFERINPKGVFLIVETGFAVPKC